MKKKTYTKYDYYCIQTKIGLTAGIFALTAMSAALLLGAVAGNDDRVYPAPAHRRRAGINSLNAAKSRHIKT